MEVTHVESLSATTGREQLWIPLLARLTRELDTFTIWKDPETAFTGSEDIDAATDRAEWPLLEEIFREWARGAGFTVVTCRHIPHTINLFALVDDGRSMLQLEVKDRTSLRGAVLFRARDLPPLSHIDPRGFRVLRPGAEAVLKLTLHGLRRGGRPNRKALIEHGVIDRLRDDADAADAATQLYGPARGALRRGVRAAVEGGWDRRAMLTVEALSAMRAFAQPQVGIRRWWFRRVTRPRCPVLQTVYTSARRIEGDREEWLRVAERGHSVISDNEFASTRGRFVVLVGPDGVGKTTVAREMLMRHPGEGAYLYFRPPLGGRLPALPPEGRKPRGNKQPRPQPMVLGWFRLLKNVAWFWLGYARVVRPVLRRGGLVVGDRWAYGYAVQPGPLKFFGPDWLGRMGVRVMPHPDLVVNLSASPEVIVARKDELTAVEAARELDEWRALPVPRIETVDATASPGEVATSVLDRLGVPVSTNGSSRDR